MLPQLPTEVLTRIAEHLRPISRCKARRPFGRRKRQNQIALARLARTSRLFHAIATPLLYDSPLLLTLRETHLFDRTCGSWLNPWTITKLNAGKVELPRVRMVRSWLRCRWCGSGGREQFVFRAYDDLAQSYLRSTLAPSPVYFTNLTSIDIADNPERDSLLAPLLAPGQPLRLRLRHLRLKSTNGDIYSLQDWLFQMVLFLDVAVVEGSWPRTVREESIARARSFATSPLSDEDLMRLEWGDGDWIAGSLRDVARSWDDFSRAEIRWQDWSTTGSKQLRRNLLQHPDLPFPQPYSPFIKLVFLEIPFTTMSDCHMCAIFLVDMIPPLRILIVKDYGYVGAHYLTEAAHKLVPAMRRSISRLAGDSRPAGTWILVVDDQGGPDEPIETSVLSELELRKLARYNGPKLDRFELTARIFREE